MTVSYCYQPEDYFLAKRLEFVIGFKKLNIQQFIKINVVECPQVTLCLFSEVN